METKKLKTMAARLLGVGKHRIWVDASATEKIKEALTKEDVRNLIRDRIVQKKRARGTSRGRARALHAKRRKGRKKGHGKRSGTRKARSGQEAQWVNRVRALRTALRALKKKETLKHARYRKMYKMVKGNYFKGKKALEQYAKGEA